MTEQNRVVSLENRVSHLDSAVAKLVAKMEAHLEEKRDHEKTLRNIDDNVKSLTIQMAAASGERHKETERLLHPVWDVIRKHDGRFHECGTTIKDELRKEARSHLALVWVGLICIVSLAAYTYNNDRDDIRDDIQSIIGHIDKHHTTWSTGVNMIEEQR